MSLYTLYLATVININKELPVKAGLTLEECRAAALQALGAESNYAKCRPTQPEKPVVFVKLPSGLIVEVERKNGGYQLPPGHTATDQAFVTTVLGKVSSSVHSAPHGPARMTTGPTTTPHIATD
ncbi:hypothetical protein [Pseudomonas sp. SLFW]|uniref:hypothetical protein n=1 Tax=Pseudomonas sp. SLFW TaxID=2683259 RepID=UPI001411DC31|nr:hypothetical protein [Pseudomonas sp. SLFW]NBB09832.1 hypothetical protein [Pseudomonas sp. SLFW]